MRLLERTSVRRALFALVLIPLIGGMVSIGFLAWLTHSDAVASRDEAADVRDMADYNFAVVDVTSELALMRAWSSSPEIRIGEAGLVFSSWIGSQARSTDERWERVEAELGELEPPVADGLLETRRVLEGARQLFDDGEFDELHMSLTDLQSDIESSVAQLHEWMLLEGGLDRLPLVEITELGAALGAQGALLTELALTGSDDESITEFVTLGESIDRSFDHVRRILWPELRDRLLELEQSELANAYDSLRSYVRSGGRLDSSVSLAPELVEDLQLVGVFYEEIGALTTAVFEEAAARAELAGDAAERRRNVLVGVGAAALALLAAAAIAVARALGRRIDEVADVARHLSDGVLEVEAIDLPGNDEIAQLASAVDDMVGTLRVANAQIGALAAGRTDDPALDIELPGSIGRNLRTAIRRLGTNTAELKRQATHDFLTGLLDRHGLDLVIEQFDVSPVGPVGVIVLDLDGFKQINDRHGHTLGDVLLTATGRRLAAEARQDDVVARLGGDEFVLLVPGVDADAVERLADRIVATVCKPVTAEGEVLLVGASVGWVVAPPDVPVSVAMRRADVAMFEAKQSGKGRAVGAAVA